MVTYSEDGINFDVVILLSSTQKIERSIVLFVRPLSDTVISYYVIDESTTPVKTGITDENKAFYAKSVLKVPDETNSFIISAFLTIDNSVGQDGLFCLLQFGTDSTGTICYPPLLSINPSDSRFALE